ncbi:hypothetical protein Fmac_015380 [Flemingia macrophylla]|uniref:Uncharacterized protein n=1 Tax=Flemingia macrophylla TaxID=520843 RepID=A0ABD1MEE0_9FABA
MVPVFTALILFSFIMHIEYSIVDASFFSRNPPLSKRLTSTRIVPDRPSQPYCPPPARATAAKFSSSLSTLATALRCLACGLQGWKGQWRCATFCASSQGFCYNLGCFPEVHYVGRHGGQCLRNAKVMVKELEYVEKVVGEFGKDNRAGIEGTLHRISAIRSKNGHIVGLIWEERFVCWKAWGWQNYCYERHCSSLCLDELHKRVVIVDTSNEIGSDGNVPHAAIGNARRMQVPEPSMQHRVMIEAVENHMPEEFELVASSSHSPDIAPHHLVGCKLKTALVYLVAKPVCFFLSVKMPSQ